MDERKVIDSFRNIKIDIDGIRSDIVLILNELKSLKSPIIKDKNSGKFFTSKVTITEEMINSVNEVFDSGIFTSGEKVKEFEKKFSEYLRVKHSVAVINGTIAIEVALRSLGIEKGDEVIVPSNTTMPTVEPILNVGATPIFVDCLEDTYNLDPKEVMKNITKKTKAVIAVHLYGNPANIDELVEICEKKKIFLIEDCAQAHGSKYKGRYVGTFGVVGCFSFYPTKNLTVCGEGGMIVTNDDDIAKKARMISNHGEEGRYNHVILGNNYRLAEIPSAIGIKQLEMLEFFNERRRQIGKIYNQELKDNEGIILPKETDNSESNYHLYVIRVAKDIRDKIIEKMKEENIFLGIHYPTPVHQQQVIKKIMNSPKLKNTEKISKEIISLPIYPLLKDEEAEMIARKVKRVINSL